MIFLISSNNWYFSIVKEDWFANGEKNVRELAGLSWLGLGPKLLELQRKEAQPNCLCACLASTVKRHKHLLQIQPTKAAFSPLSTLRQGVVDVSPVTLGGTGRGVVASPATLQENDFLILNPT